MGKSLILAGALLIITAAIFYPFWPDSVVVGRLGSSLVMGGIGVFTVLLGAVTLTKS